MLDSQRLRDAFSPLSTAVAADAILRVKVPVRVAPAGVRALRAGTRLVGRVLPARHYGSVDVFLEAMTAARAGDVLVIDNGGRTDEACIGDLIVLEARARGLAGLIVWGLHRDTPDLADIGLPVFSYGPCPFGPRRLDAREPGALRSARVGGFSVSTDDVVFADDDGVLFVPADRAEAVLAAARAIHQTERRQAERIRAGTTLHEQLGLDRYLARRAADPAFTLRDHLREIGGAIEE
jgi:regulator of RNase E activity RraA